MTRVVLVWMAICGLAGAASPAVAGPASGGVKSKTGAIAPRHAMAYVVRDGRNARQSRVELLLTDVSIDASRLRGELDPHVVAINFDQLRDHDYLLLWVGSDGTVTMNATYSKTMTQYINDSDGGLKAVFTTNTAEKIEGRVFTAVPLKSMDGDSYTIDVKFAADVIPAAAGQEIPEGGGDAGRALAAFLAAAKARDWPAIKAGLSPTALPMFDKSYNTPAENADTAAELVAAWLPLDRLKVARGLLVTPAIAVLDVEGERFGSPWLSLVRMVKAGEVWQFDQSAPAGAVP